MADNSYSPWSHRFLEFCEDSAKANLEYIEKLQKPRHIDEKIIETISDIPPLNDQNEALNLVELVDTLITLPAIMEGWYVLHTFIKPVLDANTLRVPNPFINFLNTHIRKIKKFENAEIVIELIPDVTYLQHSHEDAKRAMFILRNTTPEGGLYKSPQIGFLGLPFSRSENLFLNCLLYHEAAHFISEETDYLFEYKKIKGLSEQLNIFDPYSDLAAETVWSWIEELFADIVAAKLIGPAYTLAYIKLFRLEYSLSEDRIRTFEYDHPAHALRIREQCIALEINKWQEYCNKDQWDEINKIAKIEENNYLPPKKKNLKEADNPKKEAAMKELIRFLCEPERIKEIHQLADKVVTGRPIPLDLYKESYKGIRECLEHGIVPSANDTIPHPIAIINEAAFFLLSGMDNLYKIVDQKKINRDKPSGRALLEQRVEMWCMKAIEDWLMIKNNN
jgi:hypothetical protein